MTEFGAREEPGRSEASVSERSLPQTPDRGSSMDVASSDGWLAQDSPPSLCKAGKHSATAENVDKRGRCKLCQREWFKERWRRLHPVERKSPSWDGTLEQFFKLGLIKIREPHWLLARQRSIAEPCALHIWKVRQACRRSGPGTVGARPGASRFRKLKILVQDSERCQHMLCVNPGCYRVIPKATAISTGPGRSIEERVSSQPYVTLERRILERIQPG